MKCSGLAGAKGLWIFGFLGFGVFSGSCGGLGNKSLSRSSS